MATEECSERWKGSIQKLSLKKSIKIYKNETGQGQKRFLHCRGKRKLNNKDESVLRRKEG